MLLLETLGLFPELLRYTDQKPMGLSQMDYSEVMGDMNTVKCNASEMMSVCLAWEGV